MAVITSKASKSREKLYAAVFQGADSAAAAVVATGSMPSTTKTIPAYDSAGNIIGYIALYANADLS